MIRLLVAAFAVVACWGALPAPSRADAVSVRAKPLVLDNADPERRRVGRLEWRGGVELTSSDPRFGGLSALRIAADGARFIAISDVGWRVEGRLLFGSDGRLAGVEQVSLVPLLSRRGRALSELGKHESDAESLVLLPDGGILVGFEGDDRIARYPPGGGPASLFAAPPGLQKAPSNAGLETLVRLADGRLLAITEGLEAGDGVRGWISGKKGAWQPFVWRTSGGFVPTDATQLPSGDVLVLERRFPPVGARLRLLPVAAIKAGAVLDGSEIARLEGSLQVDNMEGIDARTGPNGETEIVLVSDDNYSFLQRTLLLMFRLVEQ